jgi:phenylpropionate dioxygenase-like ring-hydroxylating dioxygenase large terminal subunit
VSVEEAEMREDGSLERLVEEVRQGWIPAAIYSDPEVFAAEVERVFGRAWVFLAHESEVPEPGDYVVRRVVHDSFIVVRDEHGTVRVLANVCRHRGMQVCRAERGNASHFRCTYHGWTYRNTGDLVGVPFHEEAYGGDRHFPKSAYGLLSAPRVASYNGLVFASLDPLAPDLEDYLGGFRYYLDLYTRQSPAGLEVRGPQRWRVRANWKIGAENFCGDTYHTPYTHQSIAEIGLFGEHKPSKRKEGALYFADRGGGTTYKLPPGSFAERLRYVGYPEEMIERMERTWSAEQRALIGEAGFMVSAATLFPNLSFVHNWPRVREGGPPVPFLSIRLWQPVGPDETEVYSWFAVDRLAPEEFKRDSYRSYLLSFGTSGMFEQDDVENWTSITAVAAGRWSGRIRLHSRMGLAADGTVLRRPLEGWPGPGQAFQGFGEYNQRALLGLWCQYLEAREAVRR